MSCTRWSGILSPSESSEHFTCGSELVLTKGSRHCRRDWGEYTECSPTPYLLYIIYRLHAVFYIYSAACTVWESTPCWLSSSTATYTSMCLYTSYLRMYTCKKERTCFTEIHRPLYLAVTSLWAVASSAVWTWADLDPVAIVNSLFLRRAWAFICAQRACVMSHLWTQNTYNIRILAHANMCTIHVNFTHQQAEIRIHLEAARKRQVQEESLPFETLIKLLYQS